MKNHDPQENFDHPEFLESIENYPWIRWTLQNGKVLALIGMGIVALVILYLKLMGTSQTAESYFKAEQDFLSFKKSAYGQEDAIFQDVFLKNLNAHLKNQPDLQAKYDGAIGQILLNVDKVSDATPYINRTLTRTRSDALSFYSNYSETTELIAKKEYQEAFLAAKGLQQRLAENPKTTSQSKPEKEFGDILLEFNLLRIAILAGQIGDKKEELSSWNDLLSLFKSPQAKSSINKAFSEGKFTLEDYIKIRLNILNASSNS